MLTSSTQSFGDEDGMHAPDGRGEARDFPNRGNYIAKAVPATTAVYKCKTSLGRSSVPRSDGGKLFHLHKVLARGGASVAPAAKTRCARSERVRERPLVATLPLALERLVR